MEILLGLLTTEPMSGYDLGLTIRGSVGHFWQKGKPDRHIYSITRKGREHLAAWLAVEPRPEIPRNELLLKLFFGAQVPVEILIGYVEGMVERERALVLRFTQAG